MMEHGRFAYSPIVDRPPLRWPNGARLALWVIPNIEYIHFDTLLRSARPGAVAPDMIPYAAFDYGNRVAIWRIMALLDRFNIRATVALNSDVCDVYPQIIREGVRRKWEWMGHGVTNGRPLGGLDEAAERALIAQSLARIEAATGSRPRGWLGPALAETVRTPDLLKEAGIDYVADWVNDDQPYPMQTAHGELHSVPYSTEINDTVVFPQHTPVEFLRMIKDQFDTLYGEAAETAKVMAIALHPGKIGVAHRIRYLAEGLEYINGHEHVWWATGSEILDAYRQAAGRRP
ncbi:MAG: polysaccharide deacetylase family protein [Candidatus Lustribacter sp.]|jgi:peptidoglycan/xylan/chitin deacetylase (PgdA/CDA1 family)